MPDVSFSLVSPVFQRLNCNVTVPLSVSLFPALVFSLFCGSRPLALEKFHTSLQAFLDPLKGKMNATQNIASMLLYKYLARNFMIQRRGLKAFEERGIN